MFRTVLLAVVAFVAANLDDLFLLVGFFSDPKVRVIRVVAGQFMGSGLLVAASLLCSLLALVIPKSYMRIVGVLPLLIGIKGTARHSIENNAPRRSSRNVLEVAAVALSCGTNNIAVYVPFFTGRTFAQNTLIVGVFAAMTGLWCGSAYYLVNHKKIGHVIRRWGPVILPWTLIGLGAAILCGFALP